MIYKSFHRSTHSRLSRKSMVSPSEVESIASRRDGKLLWESVLMSVLLFAFSLMAGLSIGLGTRGSSLWLLPSRHASSSSHSHQMSKFSLLENSLVPSVGNLQHDRVIICIGSLSDGSKELPHHICQSMLGKLHMTLGVILLIFWLGYRPSPSRWSPSKSCRRPFSMVLPHSICCTMGLASPALYPHVFRSQLPLVVCAPTVFKRPSTQ